MTDRTRLIESAFPLREASLDSVHEKTVRHGHISTLHVWPARRPLAACRAALIATLLSDPGTPEARRALCEKIGGRLGKKNKRKKMPNGMIVEREEDVTIGGILRWGREIENAEDFQWFRDEIRRAYGGRAPRVLDPFAGGGAIPLEAMRLGCEATAVDINPVAWFILKCTLEYPQRLAGQRQRLPDFILRDRIFMEAFFKSQGLTGAALRQALDDAGHIELNTNRVFERFDHGGFTLDAGIAWNVRAWGRWVLARARRELAAFYPTYADFQPLKPGFAYEPRSPVLIELDTDGVADPAQLNAAEWGEEYLENPKNPRWVAKPVVAYLWARTVRCKQCRGLLPLLKTRWLCRKDNRRVILTVTPAADGPGIIFGVDENVPIRGGNTAQRRENDKRISAGTMTRSGACCPRCEKVTMTMEDLRLEGKAGRLGQVLTTVVLDGPRGKEFRVPTEHECVTADEAEKHLDRVFAGVPFGLPTEAMASGEALGFRAPLYGIDHWNKLYTPRQLVSLGELVKATRAAAEAMKQIGVGEDWREAIFAYLVCGFDRLVDFANVNTQWKSDVPTINHALVRFAIQITWDFAEGNPVGELAGSYLLCLDRIAIGLETFDSLPPGLPAPHVIRNSAIKQDTPADLVITDPPYYDSIPYSDLMDWFYVWLRRCAADFSPEYARAMSEPLGPKWSKEANDGELIDDSSRHEGSADASKKSYEDGMARAFKRCADQLAPDGRIVVVFANKQPDAWETLVSSFIRAGFVVEGSWPIQTEQPSRTRGQSSAALASSVWLVGKKRDVNAIPGWDMKVLTAMRTNIREKLREFWDARINGPDFIWAATGPALEAYSRHPIVKKSNAPGQLMEVREFLDHVRSIVVEYAVGRVLGVASDEAAAAGDRLDPVTSYYLLHRYDFGFNDAPAGACILYAVSCGMTDRELVATWDLIIPKGGSDKDEEHDAEDDDDAEESTGSGSCFRLKAWAQRLRASLGYEAPGGRPVPLINRLHRLLQLWKEGDATKVDDFLDSYALRRSEIFHRLVQSLIELSPLGTDERSLLESLSNHIGIRGLRADYRQAQMKLEAAESPTS